MPGTCYLEIKLFFHKYTPCSMEWGKAGTSPPAPDTIPANVNLQNSRSVNTCTDRGGFRKRAEEKVPYLEMVSNTGENEGHQRSSDKAGCEKPAERGKWAEDFPTPGHVPRRTFRAEAT